MRLHMTDASNLSVCLHCHFLLTHGLATRSRMAWVRRLFCIFTFIFCSSLVSLSRIWPELGGRTSDLSDTPNWSNDSCPLRVTFLASKRNHNLHSSYRIRNLFVPHREQCISVTKNNSMLLFIKYSSFLLQKCGKHEGTLWTECRILIVNLTVHTITTVI